MNLGPGSDLNVAAQQLNGNANGGGLRIAQSSTDVYYVPIDKAAMLRVQDFYLYVKLARFPRRNSANFFT